MSRACAMVLSVAILCVAGLLYSLVEYNRATTLAYIRAGYVRAAVPGIAYPVWTSPSPEPRP